MINEICTHRLPGAVTRKPGTFFKPSRRHVVSSTCNTGPIMFDADVASLLRISTQSFQRLVLHPRGKSLNPNDAGPEYIGARRIWLRENV